MKDILGREINQNDLVVAKGTGRYNNGLRVGIFNGNSVRFKNSCGSYNQVFLIENPSEFELKYKNEILEQINKEKQLIEEREKERKSKKAIPKKELIIGQQYITDTDSKVIYLGYGKVNEYQAYLGRYEDWRLTKEEEGFIYINEGWKQDEVKLDYDTLKRYEVRKTRKRLVDKTDKKLEVVNNGFTAVENKEISPSIFSYNYKYKIEFQLDDFTKVN